MRRAPVHTLTAYELAIMKENNLKSHEAQIARKYHRCVAVLGELEALVNKEPGRTEARVASQAPAPAAPEAAVPAAPPNDQWQLVPVARQPAVRRSEPQRPTFLPPMDWSNIVIPHRVKKQIPLLLAMYTWAFTAIWFFFLLLPFVFMMAFAWAAVAVIIHLVSHPELLVSGSFDAAWSVPEYFRWAGSRMASQFMNETSSRIR